MPLTNASLPNVNEGSSATVYARFLDDRGLPVVPNEGVVWSLKDDNGNIINGREDEVIVPAVRVGIVLRAADTQVGSNGTKRVLIIDWTYDNEEEEGVEGSHWIRFELNKRPR